MSTPTDKLLGKWNQTRKDGWELLVCTQHEDNVDATIKRNLTYGVLLAPAWKPVTRWDPRVKALARIMTEKRRAQFAEYVAAGLFPPGARPPTIYPGEVTHPLYVSGRKWHWPDFRNRKVRPLSRHRWWWSWDVANAYDTNEVLEAQQSKGIIL